MSGAFRLGRPGDLRELPDPAPGIDRSPTPVLHVHQLLSGGRAVDRAPRTPRTWRLRWVALTVEEYTVLAAFTGPDRPPGPYTLVDPTAPTPDTTAFVAITDVRESIPVSGEYDVEWTLIEIG